jgi:hypothetical protein
VTISPATSSVVGEILDDVVHHQDAVKPILGRDIELEDLTRHLGLQGEPRSRSLLLAGDAGVGKISRRRGTKLPLGIASTGTEFQS